MGAADPKDLLNNIQSLLHPSEDRVREYFAQKEQRLISIGRAVELGRPPNWLYKGTTLRGGVHILAGEPKLAGKSLLMLSMCLCAAVGQPFMKRPLMKNDKVTTEKCKVVFANLEDGITRIGYRAKQFGATADMTDDICSLRIIENVDDLWFYLQCIAHDPCEVLVIDPMVELYRYFGIDDENNAAQIAPLIAFIREICRKTGVQIILNHHYRKSGDRMRGSSAFEAATDGWLDLIAPKKGDMAYRELKGVMRDGPPFVIPISLIIDDKGNIVMNVVERDDGEDSEVKEEERKRVKRGIPPHLENPEDTYEATFVYMRDNARRRIKPADLAEGFGVGVDRVEGALTMLERGGFVKSLEGGKWQWNKDGNGRPAQEREEIQERKEESERIMAGGDPWEYLEEDMRNE